MRDYIKDNVRERFQNWKSNGNDYEDENNFNAMNFNFLSAVIMRKKKDKGDLS